VSSGLLRRVALVRTNVSEEPGAAFITRLKEAPGSTETLVIKRATRRNNPEDTILHSHRRENIKSYKLYSISKHCLEIHLTDMLFPSYMNDYPYNL
jgi:hypothetical protein